MSDEGIPITYRITPRRNGRTAINLNAMPDLNPGDWVRIVFSDIAVDGIPSELSAVLPVSKNPRGVYCTPPFSWNIGRTLTLSGTAYRVETYPPRKRYVLSCKSFTVDEVMSLMRVLHSCGATAHLDGAIVPHEGDTVLISDIPPSRLIDVLNNIAGHFGDRVKVEES